MRRIVLACGLLGFSHGALAANFGGVWNITAIIGGNPATIRCALVQKRKRLTGTCKPAQFGPSEVAGTVSGTEATWSYDVVFNGNQSHVEYDAVLGKDGRLTGQLHLGPMPVQFAAVRE